MSYELITNENLIKNHLSKLSSIAKEADTLIIVSPFISTEIDDLLNKFNTIKQIILYTSLDKYNDSLVKVSALESFYLFCENHKIDYRVFIDDELHGKIYLFYQGQELVPKGCVITSANFTRNGLVINHEVGTYISDSNKQKELGIYVNSLTSIQLNKKDIIKLVDGKNEWLKNHKVVKTETFDASSLLNLSPNQVNGKRISYLLKLIGVSSNPFKEGTVFKGDKIGFPESQPPKVKKNDILIFYSVGTGQITGYYSVLDGKASYYQESAEDRWPWKIKVKCLSKHFEMNWWKFGLKANDLVNDFLLDNKSFHITQTGKDNLNSINWGNNIYLSEEFGKYIIRKIQEKDS